jgi:hypothetical protein
MVDDYAAACERESATGMTVKRYDGEQPGTRDGITRQSGILATGVPNPRERELATFRGQELISRRANKR